jgi:hypothetical protein
MTPAAIVLIAAVLVPGTIAAQTEEQISQANNPLADANGLNFQDQFGTSVSGTGGVTNTMNLRGIMVKGRHIVRATLPIVTVPVGNEAYASGLGDFNIFDAIRLTPADATTQYGVGPLLVIPTATDDQLGAGKWQLGFAAVGLKLLPGGSVLGALVTFQTDFAGDGDRSGTALATAQPVATIGVGKGFYLRSSAIWLLDFENDRYLIPFGIGAGKVLPVGRTVLNAFMEPQVAVYEHGPGFPIFQVFAGVNLQWAKGRE